MFLLERLVGVSIYSILLLFICNGICISKPESGKNWLSAYAIMLGILGFFYIPGPNADLTRLFIYYRDISQLSFDALLEYCRSNSRPAQVVYFWLIGRSGIDGMLPGVTALLYYSMVFNAFWCFAKAVNASQKELAWAVALFMSFGVFVEVISGIRSSIAIAVCFWCCTRELTLNTNPLLHLPFYLFAILMHPMGTFIVLLRFLTLLFERTKKIAVRISRFVVVAALIALLATRGSSYLQAMVDKGTVYATTDVYSNKWEMILHGILVLISAWLLFRTKNLAMNQDALGHGLVVTQIPLLGIVLAGLFIEYAIYHRFSTYLGMFSSLSYMYVFSAVSNSGLREDNEKRNIKIAILLMLFLACARGNLCDFKFFLLG